MTLDWVDRLSGTVRRSEPSHGCSTSSLRASSPDHWTNCCITPCQKSPSRIFPFMYVALYPFFQFVTSSNIWTLMLTTSQEITVTNYTGEAREYLKKLITAMGATFTPSMTGKNTVLIAALYVPFPLLLLLLLPIFSSFLLFFPTCFQSLTHSALQPLGNKSNQSPILVHPSRESYLARRLLCPMAQPHSGSGEIHRLPSWCGFQHAPWGERCGCGTGHRGRGEGEGGR